MAWGMVNRLCEPASVLPEAIGTARSICRNAPLSIVQAKKSIDLGAHDDWTGLFSEIECYNRLIFTEDRREGIRAFNEKRSPDFKGRVTERPAVADKVTIREVGPRDGLQMAKSVMPTDAKIGWISALVKAGLREIEAGSFVSPKLLPQMADPAVLTVKAAAAHADVRIVALAPNLKGAQRAADAGAHVVSVPVSVSEEHSQANTRRSVAEVLGGS